MKTSHHFTALAALGVLTAVSGFSYPAFAAPSAAKFAHEAAEGDAFEIQTSQLALEKSQNTNVKQFAQQMIDDHSKADGQLKTAITNAGLSKPVTNELTSDDQLTLNHLSNLSGPDFDKKYVGAQKDAHKGAVKLFKSYSQNGDNDTLKNFAAQTLPTLQEHKQHIDQLADAIK